MENIQSTIKRLENSELHCGQARMSELIRETEMVTSELDRWGDSKIDVTKMIEVMC